MSAVLVFRVGARTLAADASEILAVVRRPPLTRVPHGPPTLAGVGALRGRATPVFELAVLLGEGEGGGGRLLLLRGETPAAVAVDEVEGMSEAKPAAAEWLDLRAAVTQSFPQTPKPRAPQAVVAAGPQAARERELGFVEFLLGGQRFAFPIDEVRTVAPAPKTLFEVPEADPVVLGLAAHGEAVLPIVDLSGLLGLPRRGGSHMLVVAVGGRDVGLRVERLLGVLRVASGAVAPAPALLNRGAGEARVTAVARGPSGLTAILSSRQLFDDETMQRLDALAPAGPEGAAAAAPARAAEAMLVFRVGDDRYALPAADVLSVARRPKRLSRPPQAPAFMAGVASRAGDAVPIIDLRLRFGVEAGDGGAVLFVRCGASAAGWLVDEAERVAHIPRDSFEDAPALVPDVGPLFAAVAAADDLGRPLLVIDARAALEQTQRDLSAWTAARRASART